MSQRTLELVSFVLITVLMLPIFQVYAWEGEGEGTVVVSTVSARIDSYSPSSQITVKKGESFTISVRFTNTGSAGAYFYAGASIWDSNGGMIFDDWSGKIYLNAGQQESASWTHTINMPGVYNLQFGVWDETKSKLLDKKPSPSQPLIKVVESASSPTISKSFSITIPQGGSGQDTIVLSNPNDVSIKVTRFVITSVTSGVKGTMTIAGTTKQVSVGTYWELNLDIAARGQLTIQVEITAATDCPSGTYIIKYKLSGTP